LFPEKIGRQSYDFVQERLAALEAQTVQQNRQMEVVMSSIAGGLKISRDDETYSFAFVSREAAALFGYTVEEFMEASGGSAVGAVYPPDLAHALADCAEAFRDGGLSYSTRYRVRCKDGSLKWIIDSGKKARDAEGNWMVNSLYLDVTQAEEDSQRLREQTALLTSIYDTVPCGIIRFVRRKGGACDLISLNRAALSLLGYGSMEEGLRDWHGGVLGSVLEEDRVMLRKTYLLLHEVGDRQDREYRARWRDGSVHWLEGTNMIVGRTEEGDAVIQRTMIDITPRRALQQQLEQEQEMYRVAMESSSDTLFEYLVDSDTFISYEPQHGQGIIRREIRDYSRRLRDETFIHPEDVPATLDNICNGRGEMFEMRVVTPGAAPGDYRWHRVSSRPILREGRLSRVVGTIRDIHSMKETLSENSERLHMSQSALQAISGMYVSIFYVNLTANEYYAVRLPQASDAMAFPRTGSFTGDLCERLLPHVAEGDRPRVARLCDRERLLGEFSRISGHSEAEFHRNASDGTASPWLRLEIHPVSTEGAETRTAIVTLRNISGEKRRELERQAEDQAAKRALEEAYEGARRANHAKSEFLSRMSHDIRTPMNAILGMTSIAEKQLGDPDKLADCLGKIRISGNHLLGLINEVLDMSKIESGNVSLSENTFLVSDTLNTVMQIIRSDAESKEQQIVLRSYLRHDAVHGDFMRVQQILLNLLSNAVKYTDGRPYLLTAEEQVSGRSGSAAEFTVEDGIGMPPDSRKLSPRSAGEGRPRERGSGTGWALPSPTIWQMMNGTIRVESQPDKGTRFVVTIFLKLAGEDAREAGSCAGSPARQGEAFPPGTRLLLVEDNDLNREIARELLGMAGLEIACAENGRQAVDLFASHPPGAYALILMDIQMPVVDGSHEGDPEAGRRGEAGCRGHPHHRFTANAFADDVTAPGRRA
ncbi:MAG: PAS domain-containing protein, partial [Anaerotruncus massiliensis (ex Togo et al. 2019)]